MHQEDNKLCGTHLDGVIPSRGETSNSLRTSFFLFSSPVSYKGVGLHLSIRWWMCVTARFITHAFSPSCSSLSSVMKQTTSHSCTHTFITLLLRTPNRTCPAKNPATMTSTPHPVPNDLFCCFYQAYNIFFFLSKNAYIMSLNWIFACAK